MAVITIRKQVDAPPDAIFAVATDLANCPGRLKGITKMEVLTPGPVGLGTRFRETRVMFGREATEEMEISAFDPPKSYELRCQSCGAEYHIIFSFTPNANGTRMDVEFRTRAVSFMAKLMTPLSFLMKGMLRKCLDQDLEDIKRAAEAGAASVA